MTRQQAGVSAEAVAKLVEKMPRDHWAQMFHEVYEMLAPKYNYETRKESSVPWDLVPAANKELMIATANIVLDKFKRELEALATAPPEQVQVEQSAPSLKCECQPIHSQECVFRDVRSSNYRNFFGSELGRATSGGALGTYACQLCGRAEPHTHPELAQEGLSMAQTISAILNHRGQLGLDELAQLCSRTLREELHKRLASHDQKVREQIAPHDKYPRVRNHREAEALRQHDQKVRAEVLEEAAKYLENAPPGTRSGHIRAIRSLASGAEEKETPRFIGNQGGMRHKENE